MENRCNKCGHKEADHDSCKTVLKNGEKCSEFITAFKHSRKCPIIGCNGDCEVAIAYRNARLVEEKRCQTNIFS